MKSVLSTITCLALAVVVVGCSKKKPATEEPTTAQPTATASTPATPPSTTPPASTTPTPTAAATPTTSTEPIAEKEKPAAKTETSSSSYNIDKYLDDWEEYMDDYIAMLKKVKNNDPSAMSEYMSTMKKAQDMQRKLGGMKDQMTPAHLDRMNKLNMKMANATKSM